MSNRVTAGRRKPSSQLSKRSASNKQKAKTRPSKKAVAVKAKKPSKKPVPPTAAKKVARPKVKSAKIKRRKQAAVAKKVIARPQKAQKKAKRETRRPTHQEVTKPTRVQKKAEATKKTSSKAKREPRAAASIAPLTPRSIAPPVIPEPNPQPKVRVRSPGKIIVRAAYVSPAQRVLEAQQAAQLRSRRIQPQREESAPQRAEPSPPSEVSGTSESGAISSEPRTSAAFVRRGRLGPRDPNSGPSSEPQASSTTMTGTFDKEWKLIASTAHRASIKLERELVQGWLEPWLGGKDTLALIQSATNSGDAYFIATHALSRKTLLVQRSETEVSEIAAHWTRLGLNVYALRGSDDERKSILGRFTQSDGGTLVVPLSAFDDNALITEILQTKINGLIAEEAQRVSELSFDFDVAYDRLPNIINRLGRPPTLAILRSAPPSVRSDLPHRLGLRSPQRVDLQPLPDTIALEVPVVDIPHRGGTLLERIGQVTHPVMVLCSAPEEVDEILEVFARASIPARASWALSGMGRSPVTPPVTGNSQIITVGVSGLPSSRDALPRTIIHYHAPSSLEQYSRDLGRLDTGAGNTSAIVLAALEDEPPMRQWLDRQRPRPEDLMQVATVLNQHAGPGKMALVDTLSASVGVGRARLESLLSLLASAGWVEHKLDWVRVPDTCTDLLDRARALAARLRSLRERDHQRMRSVSAYVIGRNCRHESMRRHFGTAAQRPCGLCDNCRTKAAHSAANDTPSQSEVAEPNLPSIEWQKPNSASD